MSSITYHIKKQGINFSFKKLCGLLVLDDELEDAWPLFQIIY